MDGRKAIEKTDRELNQAYKTPLSLEEFVNKVIKNPHITSQASTYLLKAIESEGIRKVVEKGEEKERYRFFDDPWNNGEHAILGNTDILNQFVDSLRSISSGRGKGEKMIWIEGPTATGKSEFKRCLINGLKEYSKTEEGRRYTLEWNVSNVHEWGSEKEWYESPVQINPLTIFPKNIYKEIIKQTKNKNSLGIEINQDLDPFSKVAYNYLKEEYREKKDIFSSISSKKHLRVKNYIVDIGKGIGVLHADDTGSPRERLVGSWMPEMLRELGSRGKKNPQAFSYTGVLSQGNSGITIIEDAFHHADLLQRLLNVSDESVVKIDEGTAMDIDSVLIIISNPDLEAQLDSKQELREEDPFKALKRRLEKHEFKYLTNLSLEAELLRRELNQIKEIRNHEEIEEGLSSPLTIKKYNKNKNSNKELAPHTIETASMYNVLSRLDNTDLPPGFGLVDKAILYDIGYIEKENKRLEKKDLEFSEKSDDGEKGIPVTYARDVIAELLGEKIDRSHSKLNLEDVIMPDDILDAMVERMDEKPIFSEREKTEYKERAESVRRYIREQQEKDVLNSIMRDKNPEEKAIEDYIKNVQEWIEVDERKNEVGPDPLKMKLFEIEELGRFSENDYINKKPASEVEEFRKQVAREIKVQTWKDRTDRFEAAIGPKEIPSIRDALSSYSVEDVKRQYKEFNPKSWKTPPENTETEKLKHKTIQGMVEVFDYSRGSAELTSRKVVERWV